MVDNTALEYFLSLLDEGERILSSDPLCEKHTMLSYTLKEKEEKPVEDIKVDESFSVNECRACHAWVNRVQFVPAKESSECKVMCIISSPKINRLLTPKGEMFFLKWFQGIGLDISNVALTTLVKCPLKSFSALEANACKGFLKEEMTRMKPERLLLLGEDVAHYMLRRNDSMNEMRGRKYKINNIPTFVSYSPDEFVEHYNELRAPVWQDLLFLKENL